MRFLFLSVVLVFTVLAFASCDGKKMGSLPKIAHFSEPEKMPLLTVK